MLYVGGGDAVIHSKPMRFHGFGGACSSWRNDHRK